MKRKVSIKKFLLFFLTIMIAASQFGCAKSDTAKPAVQDSKGEAAANPDDAKTPPQAIAPGEKGPSSSWVYFGPKGNLEYKKDELGNRVMDFSTAGYMGGGVAIPEVPVKVTLKPSGGDDTDAIQNAIDEVSAMPLVDGSHGAVLLAPGAFNCSQTIRIRKSGVVIRGSGSGDNGTVINMTGKSEFLLFDIAGAGKWISSGSVDITDSYVPSGTDTVNVKDASGFKAGDTVLIIRTATKGWISFMGMDKLVRDGKPQTWLGAGSKILTDRVIKSIAGNKITFDASITDSFDSKYLGNPVGTVAKYNFPGRISQVGLEHLVIKAPVTFDKYRAINMDAVIDSWAQDLVIQDGADCFFMSNTVKRVTADNIIVNHTVSFPDSAAPADFSCTGTQILFNKCQANDLKHSGNGSWAFVTQATGTGPIVNLNFTSTENNGAAPHQRWTTGVLIDGGNFANPKNNAQGIRFSNRNTMGSGHGWPMGWCVAWNVKSPVFQVSQGPGTKNWCIGGIGNKASSSDPEGTYDSFGTMVAPSSLYLQQLKDRLGPQALKNIGY